MTSTDGTILAVDATIEDGVYGARLGEAPVRYGRIVPSGTCPDGTTGKRPSYAVLARRAEGTPIIVETTSPTTS